MSALPTHAEASGPGAPGAHEAGRLSVSPRGVRVTTEGSELDIAFSEIYTAFVYRADLYLLLDRGAGKLPWVRVPQPTSDAEATRALLERIQEGGGGYRAAMRRRRQGLDPETLLEKILAHEPLPGALEVPCTIIEGIRYPGLAAVQLAILSLGSVLGLLAVVTVPTPIPPIPELILLAAFLVAGLIAHAVGKRWRAAVRRNHPGQKRVLVLTPDGCVAGFVDGVASLAWDQIGRFEIGEVFDDHEPGLRVLAPTGAVLGMLRASWLKAPLPLVVEVAEAYREAASG